MAQANNTKQEKIIEKIKKVLELSRNNPSEEEAKAAALKAQALMAQYHIDMTDIDDIQDVENIEENVIRVGGGNKWKYRLAMIIAKNFRCKCFYYGSSHVVFYGYKTDTEIAGQTFQYLFKVGNRAADTYYHKLRWDAIDNGQYFDGTGIKNNFVIGFMRGIGEALDKQCTALMIVVPQEVKTAFDKRMSGNNKTVNGILDTRSHYREQAKQAGYTKGKQAIQASLLEEKVS